MARVVARLDRHGELAFLGFRDARAAALLAPLPEEERHATWRLALPNGRLVGYGAGLVDLARALKLSGPLVALLGRIPTRILERAYGVVASRRPYLGRLVPDGPGPVRFP